MVKPLSTLGSIFSSREHFSTKNIPYTKAKRSAFSLIELIFAMVVMGITVVSLPVVMNSNDQGISATVTQEAIFGASTELNMLLSYRWDENSLDEVNYPNGLAKVIETGDCDNNVSSTTYRLRPGHIYQPLHRMCLQSNATLVTAQSAFGAEAGDFDDIDDVNVSAKSMFINDATTTSGYKTDYTSEVSITYADIGTIADTDQDAKLVEVTVKDGTTVITKLSSYTLNIGEVDMYKKTY